MDMPRPSAGHRQLEALAGEWTGEETMHPSAWDPQGGVAEGRTRSRIALEGFAVVTDYEQRRDGVRTFSGHGVFTYDPKADRVSLHWFDCMGSPPEVFTGRFEGERITLAHGGPGMHARLVYDLGSPGEMTTRMEMSPDGAAWSTLFDGQYRRA